MKILKSSYLFHEDFKEFPSPPLHDTKKIKIKTGETLFFMWCSFSKGEGVRG
jgi:hypothetical protein